jgi:hypothetical protein
MVSKLFFAGKDLLYMMRHDLKKLGFKDSQQLACYTFRDTVLHGIQSSPEDISTWLPEWQKLREFVATYPQTNQQSKGGRLNLG